MPKKAWFSSFWLLRFGLGPPISPGAVSLAVFLLVEDPPGFQEQSQVRSGGVIFSGNPYIIWRIQRSLLDSCHRQHVFYKVTYKLVQKTVGFGSWVHPKTTGISTESGRAWGLERPGMGPGVVKASFLGLAGHLTFTAEEVMI